MTSAAVEEIGQAGVGGAGRVHDQGDGRHDGQPVLGRDPLEGRHAVRSGPVRATTERPRSERPRPGSGARLQPASPRPGPARPRCRPRRPPRTHRPRAGRPDRSPGSRRIVGGRDVLHRRARRLAPAAVAAGWTRPAPDDAGDPLRRDDEWRDVRDDQDGHQEPCRDRTDGQQEREGPDADGVEADDPARQTRPAAAVVTEAARSSQAGVRRPGARAQASPADGSRHRPSGTRRLAVDRAELPDAQRSEHDDEDHHPHERDQDRLCRRQAGPAARVRVAPQLAQADSSACWSGSIRRSAGATSAAPRAARTPWR